MEFGCGRSDDPYPEEVEEEEEEEDGEDSNSNKHNMLSMASTCSSSSSFHPHPLLPPPPSAPSSSNTEKEHMFDKVVTPSDVGKLNRLVIPKQHAERHFPLDPSVDEKGLLLSFEDRTGKEWQFRYSYWRSSQSYVMTRGWSRFVKEKGLGAGDTVSFHRGAGRHFLDWKRRPAIRGPSLLLLQPRVAFPVTPSPSNYPMVSFSRTAGLPVAAAAATSYDPRHRCGHPYSNAASGSSAGAQHLPSGSAAATAPPIAAQPVAVDSLVHSQQQTTARRVRLFGVNLDLLHESDRQHPYQRAPLPLQLQQQQQQQQQAFSSSSSSPSSTASEQQQQQSIDLDL